MNTLSMLAKVGVLLNLCISMNDFAHFVRLSQWIALETQALECTTSLILHLVAYSMEGLSEGP